MRAAVLGVLILILIGSIALVSAQVRRSKEKKAEEKAKQEKLIQEEEAKNKQRKESIDQADVMAQGYDYDGAIELLKSLDNYDKDADIVAKIAGYEADKSTLVAVNMNEITHIFYHSRMGQLVLCLTESVWDLDLPLGLPASVSSVS